jgi:hypothetical protein
MYRRYAVAMPDRRAFVLRDLHARGVGRVLLQVAGGEGEIARQRWIMASESAWPALTVTNLGSDTLQAFCQLDTLSDRDGEQMIVREAIEYDASTPGVEGAAAMGVILYGWDAIVNDGGEEPGHLDVWTLLAPAVADDDKIELHYAMSDVISAHQSADAQR